MVKLTQAWKWVKGFWNKSGIVKDLSIAIIGGAAGGVLGFLINRIIVLLTHQYD